MLKAAITTSSFGKYDNAPLKLCEKVGLEVILNPHGRKVKPDELAELARNAVGIIAGTEPITEETLLELSSLKVISRCGTGMDNVDVCCAEKMGIKVFNTPDAPTTAVAELTIGLILSLMRKTHMMNADIKADIWEKLMGNLLYKKKVGIKGFGRIGKRVAELLSLFGCEIAYSDPFVEDGLLGFSNVPLEKMLGWADIVSVHVPVSEQLIGANELMLMKKGAWLLNTSRGGVIDEEKLYELLKSGYLSGAALDVFAEEPYKGPLKELDNVILTPHSGSYAKESRIEMEMQSVENLLRGLRECNEISE
ncbi:MAG TPA: hydroxyacid dehydrogenase [Nitrospirae bacterium]|nr:putative 2-hydroxyacid dehydrogenase YoaD [bacterium BMS3Abin15]HDH00306.1 hydroxyacid dehydrogenase [Nitrospirota bacterium]